MLSIPKLSAPLVKDIRTGEGLFEWGLAGVLGVAAVLPHGLTWTQSGTYLTILAGLKGVRRLLLKLVAAQYEVGIGPPIAPDLPTPDWSASYTAPLAGPEEASPEEAFATDDTRIAPNDPAPSAPTT